VRLCLSSKLYKLRVLRGDCQPVARTGFPPVFHNGERTQTQRPGIPNGFSREESTSALSVSTRQNAFSHIAPVPFRHKPRRKTISLKKDHLEVFANNA